MAWDDEVEPLGQRVQYLLGQEVYDEALNRALAVAVRQDGPMDRDSFLGERTLPEKPPRATECSMEALTDALKTEFRRLLQPH